MARKNVENKFKEIKKDKIVSREQKFGVFLRKVDKIKRRLIELKKRSKNLLY